MAIIQNFDLNMIPESEPVIVHVNQYDTGIGRLVASLYDGDTPYSPTGTAAIQGTKPDGKGFMYSATLSGNTVTADLKDQMSVVAGRVRCQIVVSETSGITGTFCFDLDVQASALPDDAEVSESDYPIIEELIHEAQTAAATAAAAEVNAEDSAEDSEAWAVGTRNGEPVPSTDPTYHNNSKYWAEHGGGGTGGHTIMDADGEDMPQRGTLQFLNMQVSDDATHGITVVTGGKGVLPYFYIDSEAGSTVTVVCPDSTVITPTAVGNHWECEVPGYGVYVIHSVLNGEDATMSITVDDVKEYHITDSHYYYTINITAQVGATVRVSCGAEVYTGTGTGSPVAFVVHQASSTYTLEATVDGYTDTQTVVSPSTSGQSTSVTLHVFTATLHISTTSQELAGETITITKGGSTVGTTAFPASGTLEVNYTVHETGSYTASVTYSGDTYSDTHTVSSETTVNFEIVTIPDGSTVTPTDDIQIWLACAGITDKAYTTLNEVLADHDTLYILMGSDNAVDYLVRSTTWATGITADEYAMKYIGKWNYASDTLLNDSTWGQAICDSAYFESVLNAKVPKLTSSTSQNVSSISDLQNFPAYQAFDRDTTTAWIANNGQSSAGQTSNEGWIGYQFTEPIKCMFAEFTGRSDLPVQEYSFKASNDGTTFSEELASGTTLSSQTGVRIPFTNNSEYAYYRMYLKQKNSSSGALVIPRVYELQFYGRSDVTEGIDVYGAASDTMTVTGNETTLTITTDLSGHCIVPKTNLPNGTYTFTSGVAKDPTNLSNDYSKSVTVTDGTAEIYIMPEGAVYWYGYDPHNMYSTSAKPSGWGSTNEAPTLSKSTNSFSVSQPTNTRQGSVLTTNQVDASGYDSYKALISSITTASGEYKGMRAQVTNSATITSGSTYNNTANGTTYNSTTSTPFIADVDISAVEENVRVGIATTGVITCNVSALWLE